MTFDLANIGSKLGLRRKRSFADKVQDVAGEVAEKAASTAQDAYLTTVESVGPVLAKSSKVATRAFSRTAKTTALGLTSAGDAASAAAATGAAAADAVGSTVSAVGDVVGGTVGAVGGAVGGTVGAVGGVVGGTIRFFGALLSWLWRLVVFLVKTALLAGVAYAGWQWLQARREQQEWSSTTYTPANPSGVAGGSYSSASTLTPAVPE